MISWVFNQGQLIAKREVSSEQMKQRRKLSSVDKIDRQKIGKRVDMAFKYDSYDIGVYEAKKSSREYSDERITDQQIKVPKIMKGMLVKLLTVAPTKLRQLETVGIITGGKFKYQTFGYGLPKWICLSHTKDRDSQILIKSRSFY